MNHANRPPKGFTLVEVLIVITIIVILLSIMAVAAGPIMKIVYVTNCQSQLKALAQVYLNYTNQYSIKSPPLQSNTETMGPTTAPSSPTGLCGYDDLIYSAATGGYGVGFGPLSWQQLITSNYYVCPAISGRDTWWHDSTGGAADDYWMPNANSDPFTSLQINIGSTPPGAPTSGGTMIIASYSIRPGLYGWTPAQVQMPHGSPQVPAVRAIIADSFYVDNTQLCVTGRHKDGVCVYYLDGTVSFRNDAFLSDPTIQSFAVNGATVSRTLDTMWQAFDY